MTTTQIADLRETIKTAYKSLRKQGYFCRSNFWCCQSCGCAAIPEGKREKYVFFHKQDSQMIDTHERCHLSWNGDGREIVNAMVAAGAKAQWDGTKANRILVWVE